MTAVDSLACRSLAADLVDLGEGTLAPERSEAVLRHVDECVDCRTTLRALEAAPGLIRPLAPGDDKARWQRQRTAILAAIDKLAVGTSFPAAFPVRTPCFWSHRERLAGGIAAAAAVVLAIVGVGYLTQHGTEVTPRLEPTRLPSVEELPDELLVGMIEALSGAPSVVPDLESLSGEQLDALDDFLGSNML